MNKFSLLIILLVALSAFCAEAFPATPAMPQKPPVTREKPPAVKPLAPARRLAITSLTVNDTAAGAPGGQEVQFLIRVTVQEPGRCSIHDVEPIIFVKTVDGKTEPVRVNSFRGASCKQGNYMDDRTFELSGTCPMICDELRGGQATLEFTSDTYKPLPALTQIGICFNYGPYPDRQQECTWYPLETVPYYRLKK